MLATSRRRRTAAAGLILGLAAASGLVLAPANAAPDPGDVRHDFAATPATLGTVPDGSSGCGVAGTPLDVVVPVSGIRSASFLSDLEVTLEFTNHNWMGDITVTLLSPGGEAEIPVFGRTNASPIGCGDPSDLLGTYTFSDLAVNEWTSTAIGNVDTMPAGVYRSADVGQPGASSLLTPAFSVLDDFNGDWILRITDSGPGDTTDVAGASLGLTFYEGCADAQDAFTAAQTALASAQATLTTAQQTKASALKALRKAKKAVTTAKQKLAKVKKATKNKKAKVKKAKKTLKAKQLKKTKKAKKQRAAKVAVVSARQVVTSAQSDFAAAVSDVDGACPA